MRAFLAAGGGIAILCACFLTEAPAQDEAEEGLAEQLGERIDHGVERLGSGLRRTWAEIRQSVDELGVQGRVYGRLRWDKEIGGTVGVEVERDNIVVLTGRVKDEPTRRKAVRLAQDTVGVREVVDRLAVDPGLQEVDPAVREGAAEPPEASR